MNVEDEPYALKELAEKSRRLALLREPHIEPLGRFVETMRLEHPDRHIPHFDPCDGGILARALFLLEAPGPKTMKSGFVSRDNPDQTARNFHQLMQNARIARRDTAVWNIVPWYVGDGQRIRPVNNDDLHEALIYTKKLLGLLPRLELIVLVGKKAQSATNALRQITDLPFMATYHPSPQVFNISLEKKRQTQEAFLRIGELLS